MTRVWWSEDVLLVNDGVVVEDTSSPGGRCSTVEDVVVVDEGVLVEEGVVVQLVVVEDWCTTCSTVQPPPQLLHC